jgi:hypothetical protein
MSSSDALANLYVEAAEYVAKHWVPGRLEPRSKASHSSQALCVSVFMTLAQRPAEQRATFITAVGRLSGLALPEGIRPDIDAEVREHRGLLGEIGGGTPTALDVLVTSPEAVLTIESKFTEREFGSCGQFRPSKVNGRDIRFNPGDPARPSACRSCFWREARRTSSTGSDLHSCLGVYGSQRGRRDSLCPEGAVSEPRFVADAVLLPRRGSGHGSLESIAYRAHSARTAEPVHLAANA